MTLAQPKLTEVEMMRGPLDGLRVRVHADNPFWVRMLVENGTGYRSNQRYLYAPIKTGRFVMISVSEHKPTDSIVWGPIQCNGKTIAHGGIPRNF